MWRICRNLVIACLGMFLLMPLSVLAESPTLDHVIAIVNEDPIFSSQLEERIQLIEGLNAQSRSKAPAPDELRRQILEQLILEALQLDIAQRSSVKISDEEFQGTLENIAQQNHLDLPGLEKALSADGINFNSYKQYIREQLLIDRIQHIAVGKRLSISEQDITNFLNSEEGKLMSSPTYHLAHILLPLPADLSPEDKRATEATSQQIIDDIHNKRADFQTLAKQYSKAQDASSGGDLGWHRKADLPTLYAAQVDRLSVGEVSQPFQAGGGIHILMLLEKRGEGSDQVQQTHARHILVKPSIIRSDEATQQLLHQLRERALAGEDFAVLAKTYSEDFASSRKGGDLGWVMPGQLVPQFEDIMNNLSVSAISYPFQTQYGWHIVQVLERRDQNVSTELLRQSARNFLSKRKFDEELPSWLKQLRNEAFVDIKTDTPSQPGNTPVTPDKAPAPTP